MPAPRVLLTVDGHAPVALDGIAAAIALQLVRCRASLDAAPSGVFECHFGDDGVKPDVRAVYPKQRVTEAA